MFDELAALNRRPQPFSVYTADLLWTYPHISARMLDFHLDAEGDMASRRADSIAAIIGWLDARFGLAGKAVCDLGCGPPQPPQIARGPPAKAARASCSFWARR